MTDKKDAELKKLEQDVDELTAQRDKLADILTSTAKALSGQLEERCPKCGYLTKNTEHIGCLRETLNAINSCEQRNFAIVDMDTSPPASKPFIWLTNAEIAELKILPGANRERTATEMAFAVIDKLKELNT